LTFLNRDFFNWSVVLVLTIKFEFERLEILEWKCVFGVKLSKFIDLRFKMHFIGLKNGLIFFKSS